MAGVPRLKPHATRHTFATTLIRRGAPIAHVSKLLGHASVDTTMQTYTHLVTDDLRGVMELLENLTN
jgi:site-specific recombinase XerD